MDQKDVYIKNHTFPYWEDQMRKHINHAIAKKDAERKARHETNGERKEPKGIQLSKELSQIKEDRFQELNLMRETALFSRQINQWALNARNTEEYETNKELASRAIRLFEENHCDRTKFPYSYVSTQAFEEWASNTELESWENDEIHLNSRNVDEKYNKVKATKYISTQFDSEDDPKRTFRRLSIEFSLCVQSIHRLEQFWAGRWS
jgi:hypothetical protein